MESQYLQNVRYKLQRRIRRLNAADHNQFLFGLKRFFAFFDSTPVLAAVAESLVVKFPELDNWVDKIYQCRSEGLTGSTEEEQAVIGYGVLRRYSAQNNTFDWPSTGARSDMSELRTNYLEPFYDYVDEHIDDRDYVLFALLKYKRRCEWFRREKLYKLWEENKGSGEKVLTLDLNEYLYEQGVAFQVEPLSASGRADIVSDISSTTPMIADAKVFKPDGGSKTYLIQGFKQVYQYTCDHNQPFGYLAIFNVTDRQLRFDAPSDGVPVPYVTLNNKTVFFLVIDVFPHLDTASKRRPSGIVEITREEILSAVTEPQREMPAENTEAEV